MAVPFGRWSFAAGEVTPELFGHVDFAKFAIGMSTGRNGFVGQRGGFLSRAGTAFVGFSKQTGRAFRPRLITFQFSVTQGLCLEFGNLYMRVISNGGFVLETAVTITAIAAGPPLVVTAPGHGYSNGDWVFFSSSGLTFVVTGVTTNTFQLTDVYGDPVGSNLFGPLTPLGTVARVFTLVTPWGEQDLPWLKFVQSADVMSICCWNQDTGTTYPAYDLARVTDSDWTLTKFAAASVIAAPATCTAVASTHPKSDGSTGPPTQYQFCVTAVDKLTGQESQASPIATVSNSVDIASTAGSLTINWSAVTGAQYYNVYMAPPAVNTTVPPGSLFGFIGQTFGTQFVNSNIVADVQQSPPLHLDPFQPGQILYVNVTSGGSGLTTVTYSVTTVHGTSLVLIPIIVGGVLQAMAVQNPGQLYAPGDSLVLNGAGFATGAISFTVNPTAGDTITLNGITWTFVTGAPSGNQTQIQATLTLTLTQLATDLTASTVSALTVASYQALPTGSATNITITYNTPGAGGDAYTLAASAATPSGPTLTGGTGSGTLAATLVVGPTTGTFPSTPNYFQQRRVYAATPNNPDDYFMSQPGAFNNYDTRVPVTDSDAIIGAPWSIQVDGIQFMLLMPGGLVVFTGIQAWQVEGAGSYGVSQQPITPANQQAIPQAFNGCSPTVPPLRIVNEIIYLQEKGSIFRDLSYNFFTNIYTGIDITVLSSHLFFALPMSEMTWGEEPFRLIWVVRADGVMLSCTFIKEEEVLAWTRHDTQGTFQSCTAVTEPPVDALYVATQRFPGPLGTQRNAFMIERMDNRDWSSVEDVWSVDAGLSYPQPSPAAAIAISSPTGLGAVTGVTDLIGGQNYTSLTTVTVLDPTGTGTVMAPTIVNGAITAIAASVQGVGNTEPQLVIADPGGGTGASATAVLDQSATITASLPVFSSGSVGAVIRLGGGKAVVTRFINTTTVRVNVLSPVIDLIPDLPPEAMAAAEGDWTMTTPVTRVSGLNHLIGTKVTGLADGQVIPPQVVAANGTITLGIPASQIVVGLGFTAQMQTLYIEAGPPTAQGRRKKIAAVTLRLTGTKSVLMGTNQPDGSTQSPAQIAPPWTNLQPVPDLGVAPFGSSLVPLYTGDVRLTLQSGFEKPGQIAVQQSNPLPMEILAVIPEILDGDQPESDVKDRNPKKAGRP